MGWLEDLKKENKDGKLFDPNDPFKIFHVVLGRGIEKAIESIKDSSEKNVDPETNNQTSSNNNEDEEKIKQEKLKKDIDNWVENELRNYEQKTLSYQINKICVINDIPTKFVDELKKVYGNEVVCPVLNIMDKFSNKFSANFSYLEDAYKNWLVKNNIEINNNNYQAVAIKHIISKTKEEAKEIIGKVMS